mmetsp:Transcript_11932/g.28904  ORF Transcript_11932/g.28904 Transcript_11932/m.28904 type:complete len:323 (+) Transcript_11932:3426-4394(+)
MPRSPAKSCFPRRRRGRPLATTTTRDRSASCSRPKARQEKPLPRLRPQLRPHRWPRNRTAARTRKSTAARRPPNPRAARSPRSTAASGSKTRTRAPPPRAAPGRRNCVRRASSPETRGRRGGGSRSAAESGSSPRKLVASRKSRGGSASNCSCGTAEDWTRSSRPPPRSRNTGAGSSRSPPRAGRREKSRCHPSRCAHQQRTRRRSGEVPATATGSLGRQTSFRSRDLPAPLHFDSAVASIDAGPETPFRPSSRRPAPNRTGLRRRGAPGTPGAPTTAQKQQPTATRAKAPSAPDRRSGSATGRGFRPARQSSETTPVPEGR